jgi:hypothetical protein
MDAWTFDSGRKARESGGIKRKQSLEPERLPGLLRREKGERDFRRVAFFAPQARPESCVYNGFDYFSVRLRRYLLPLRLLTQGSLAVPCKMRPHSVCNDACCWICRFRHSLNNLVH